MELVTDNTLILKTSDSVKASVKRWFLAEKQFDITWEEVESSTFENSVTIIRPNSDNKKKKYFFGLVSSEPLREFFGTLWFGDGVNIHEDRWVFDVYGKENIEEAKLLIIELITKFNIIVSINIADECRRYEPFPPGTIDPNFDSYSF